MIWIGINASTSTGIAVWDDKLQKMLYMESLTFWDAVYKLDELIDAYNSEMTVVLKDIPENSYLTQIENTYGNKTGQHLTKLIAACNQSERIGFTRNKIELFTQFLYKNEIKTIKTKLEKNISEEEFYEITKIPKDGDDGFVIDTQSINAVMLVFGKKK